MALIRLHLLFGNHDASLLDFGKSLWLDVSLCIEQGVHTASNESFDEKTRSEAQKTILAVAQNVEHEAAIENIIKAKGYENATVYIDGEKVEIIVKKDGFTEADALKLSDIATDQLGVSPSDIKIVPVK